MPQPSLDFWFEFASPYSYIAAMRIEALCDAADIGLGWNAFTLGPIFANQGWSTSPFVLNPARGAYMWRDLERLAAKFGLPWRKPREFPRKSTLASRVAAAHPFAPWIGTYVRGIFVANFGEDADIEDRHVVAAALAHAGADPDAVLEASTSPPLRSRLRENTERAMALGIFGAPNCVIGRELFWGEEALEDAIAWARLHPVNERGSR